jgi:hypothetical protein
MTDIWVCSTCHSINRQRNAKCYKCGASQSAATGEGATLRVENALAIRTRVRYRSAWLRGMVASLLILVVTVLGVLEILLSLDVAVWMRDQVDLIVAGGTLDQATLAEQLLPSVQIGLVRFGVLILAVLFFAAWLSRVIMNIPALGGGVPTTTPTKAFVYPLIPIVNLIKVPGMIQDALYRVDPGAGGFFMVALAWFGLVGSWIIGFIAGWVLDIKFAADIDQVTTPAQAAAAVRSYFDLTFAVEIATWLMVTLGSLVLVGVTIRIERRSRARDLEIRAAAAAPASEAGSVEARPTRPAPTHPVLRTPEATPLPAGGRGPHLTLTVGEDEQMVAEVDGESEAFGFEDLRAAAEALGRVGGSATIRVQGAGDGSRSAAREAFGILGNAGVPTTFAG